MCTCEDQTGRGHSQQQALAKHSRCEVSSCTKIARCTGKMTRIQTQSSDEAETLVPICKTLHPAAQELHSGQAHDTCMCTTAPAAKVVPQPDSQGSEMPDRADCVASGTSPHHKQAAHSQTLIATGHKQNSCTAKIADDVSTQSGRMKFQQGSCPLPVAASGCQLPDDTAVAITRGPCVSHVDAHSSSELHSPKAAGRHSRGASASRHAPEAAAMIGPFGCSMGFVQLAVPWAPQRSAVHGVPLAPAPQATLHSVQQQSQIYEASDGQRHQQLLHQLLQEQAWHQSDQAAPQEQTQPSPVQQQEQESQDLSSQSMRPQSLPELRSKQHQRAAKDPTATSQDNERFSQYFATACDSTTGTAAPLPSATPRAVVVKPDRPAAQPHPQSSASKVPDAFNSASSMGRSTQGSTTGAITMFQWPEASTDDAPETPSNVKFDFKPPDVSDAMAAPPGAPPTRRTRMRSSPLSSPHASTTQWPQGEGDCEPRCYSASADTQQQHTFTVQGKCTSMEEMLKTIPAQIMDKIGIPEDMRGALEKAVGAGLPELQAACHTVLRGAASGGLLQNSTGHKVVKVRRRVGKGSSDATAIEEQLANFGAVVVQAQTDPSVATEQSVQSKAVKSSARSGSQG